LWQVHTLQANSFLSLNPQTRGTPVLKIIAQHVVNTRLTKATAPNLTPTAVNPTPTAGDLNPTAGNPTPTADGLNPTALNPIATADDPIPTAVNLIAP
jgi:hypothetical protein